MLNLIFMTLLKVLLCYLYYHIYFFLVYSVKIIKNDVQSYERVKYIDCLWFYHISY